MSARFSLTLEFLTYQTSFLSCVRPDGLVGWAPVDLCLVERRLVGITGRTGFRAITLTSGIKVEC